jgi:cobalt-zinc-cadmium efflux system membrane fusion protein
MKPKSLFALLALVSLTGCLPGSKEDDEPMPKVEGGKIIFPPESPQTAAIVTHPAAPRERDMLRLHGRLVWDEDVTVHIFTPFGGRVSRILAQAGQQVEKDSPLAIVASSEYGQAQSEAARAELDFSLADQTAKRVRDLSLHGAVPQKELHAAEIELTRTQAEVRRTKGRLAVYGSLTNSMDQEFVLRSPLAGIVVEKNINPGQEVRADQITANAPPLFVVTDPSRLWVLLDATEQDLPMLKPGTEIKLQSQTYPDLVCSAQIKVISDFVDPVSRTIKVRAELPNPDRLLKAEMFVTAELPSHDLSGVDVPSPAVFLKGEKHYVFVEEARGSYLRLEVKIGAAHTGRVTVTEGLEPGQKVVTDGSLFLDQILGENGS